MTGVRDSDRLPPTADAASTIRSGVPRDEPVLRWLQSHLRESDATLLRYGLDTRGVIVTTAGMAGEFQPDTPVGYLLYVAGIATQTERTSAHVAELVVAPRYRRDGRGRALLDCLLTTVSGRISLYVSPENSAALSLYQSMGFAVAETRSEVYAEGPALLLVRHPSSDPEPPVASGTEGSATRRL